VNGKMSTEILIIRIQPTLKQEAEKLAEKNGISLSALTRYSLKFALEPKNQKAVMGIENFMQRYWKSMEKKINAGNKALEKERDNGKKE
jgi:antitoxin component of RelBE/YafQ-DinJ toxin-antitoxin module